MRSNLTSVNLLYFFYYYETFVDINFQWMLKKIFMEPLFLRV